MRDDFREQKPHYVLENTESRRNQFHVSALSELEVAALRDNGFHVSGEGLPFARSDFTHHTLSPEDCRDFICLPIYVHLPPPLLFDHEQRAYMDLHLIDYQYDSANNGRRYLIRACVTPREATIVSDGPSILVNGKEMDIADSTLGMLIEEHHQAVRAIHPSISFRPLGVLHVRHWLLRPYPPLHKPSHPSYDANRPLLVWWKPEKILARYVGQKQADE